MIRSNPFPIAALFLVLALFLGTGQALASEKSMLAEADKARSELMDDKDAQGLRHKWLNIIEDYRDFLARYPKSAKAPEAILTMGDLSVGLYSRSRRDSDLDDGLSSYRTLLKSYPTCPQAAAAQLAVGRVYLKFKKDPDQAYVELLKVELNHPQMTGQVNDARQLMAEISGQAPNKTVVDPVEQIPAKSGQAVISALRHWHNPTYTRVAIDLDREVKFEDRFLPSGASSDQPSRLYLDIYDAKAAPGVKEEIKIGDGLLESARLAQYDQNTVRVVLEIQNIYNYRIFSLTNPFRIVVDVTAAPKTPETRTAKAEDKPKVKPGDKTEAKPEVKTEDDAEEKKKLTDLRETAMKRPKNPRGKAQDTSKEASLARQLGLSVRKVVIDPGHGGKDQGASGITGLKEKDLTLKVAKLLKSKIEKQLGLEVVLTRDKDVFLTLEERMAKANTEAADVFISIHANAHSSASVHGFETYILNIATDKEAMKVAARENAATTKSMSDLQVILSDLMLNSKIAESGALGSKVHKAAVRRLKNKYKSFKDLGVKQAPFYVLIGANMPSILVEMGFISNKTEEERLKSEKYIEHLTDGIIDGVKQYVDSFEKKT